MKGTLADSDAIAGTVAGAEAVIDALAPQSNTRDEMEAVVAATATIVEAMRRHGARRIVLLSGAAVTAPGEHKRPFDAVATRAVRLLARWIVETRQRELDLVRSGALEWIAVRPARVADGPLTRRYHTGDITIGPRSWISRADLGHFLASQLTDDRYLGSAPFISY